MIEIGKTLRVASSEEKLLKEIRDLLDNTHSYDSEIYGKIEATLNGFEEGKKYSDNFIDSLFFDSIFHFEHTHCEETEVYLKLNQKMRG